MWIATKAEARLLPDVIILGVGKCGTRALLLFLGSHPDIVAAQQEINFFDRSELYSLGLREYIRLLPRRKRDEQILLEKTPAYFDTPGAEKRIHAAIPDVRLLVIVREPVTKMISSYVHLREKIRKENKTIANHKSFEVNKILLLAFT